MKEVLLVLLNVLSSIPVPQEHVLPVFGCGTGCRVETEQLSLPQQMADGWIKVKVRQRIWITKCDWNKTRLKCVDEPASGRAGPPVQDLWLFADCSGGHFSSSLNSDRSQSWGQSVFYEEAGEWNKKPKFGTVHGNPFMRWAKLCPTEGLKDLKICTHRCREILIGDGCLLIPVVASSIDCLILENVSAEGQNFEIQLDYWVSHIDGECCDPLHRIALCGLSTVSKRHGCF